jgi:hypothetical protein
MEHMCLLVYHWKIKYYLLKEMSTNIEHYSNI